AVLSFIVLFVLRFILGGWVDWFWVFFVISGLGIGTAVVLDWRLYLEFMTMRTTKHGANMGVLILMSLALVVASNYLGYRFNRTLDVTEEKLNSLSDQTMSVLEKL